MIFLETQSSPNSSNLKTEENKELPSDVFTHLTENAYDIENPPARLTVWDFGGQSVYYNTHHTFLSSRAIYILAIDMSLDLTDRLEDQWHSAEQFSGTVLDYTVYWIDTIHTYASQQDKSEDGVSSPRIIIVCTHKDKYLENVPKERHEEKINAYFSTLRQHIQQKRSGVHVDPCFFAIDNTCQDEDHEITDLRRYVMKIAESQKSWGEKNPIRWSRLEDELELRQPPEKRKKKLIQYGELKKLALEGGMQDENELNSFLLFHHDIGDLLHPQRFGDLLHSQTVDLSDIVILNPWWLIDTFKSIITVDKHHVKTKGSLYWFALKRGILDERLLDELWGDDSELKPILISAMVKFNILLEQNLSTTEEPTCRQFYVPTLLPIYKNPASVVGSEDTLFIQGKDNFMPHVLFNRLTVKLVQNSTSTGRKVLRRRRDFFLFKNELYYDYAVFAIDPLRGARCALRKSIDSSCIELIPLYPPGAKFDATIQGAYDKFKGHVVTVLQELMKSICPHLQLEWCVRDPRNPKKLMAIDPKETDLTASGLPEDSVYRLWFMPSSSEKVHGASPSAVRSSSDAGDAIETACKGFPREPGIVTVFPACKANEHYPPFIAVLVSIEFCGNKVTEYEGFTVNYYSWDMPDMEAQIAIFSQEAEENPIPPEKSTEFGQVIQRVSQGLFANHRNLTIISASPVKVTGGKISCMPCIVLYCHTKGVVPLGESLFPESIEGFPVDVREGYVLLSMNNGQSQNPAVHLGQSATFYSDPLRMGCSIGRRGLNLTGTLGMFVEHGGSTCFLTCSHVLGIPPPAIDTEVCQPSDADQEANHHNRLVSETVDSSSRARICGVVKERVFRNVDIKGGQYGIDAALITVKDRGTYGIPAGLDPQRLRDLKITENKLTFTREAYIECSEDLSTHVLFKCGRTTGLTKGIATFVGGAAYQPCTVEYCSDVGWTFQDTLSSMVEVCAPRTSSSAMFADCGDSGAAVFYLKNGKPYIMGMVVARTSYFSALVSPIWPILEHFNIESPREEEDMETE
ncbi:uncharacterized protein LOC106167508 [Lingula anatina]|uniref:Uncharacterized protein LOC106167508 n=1 Tax=Lingula anatina TaxID=7574 RepID=A0A1S3IUZ4_LINAN|nr:uncharacterized protein LOC106167508 [Lingula anatina]|eukprot:XP_013401761.1 uncharacterized protein LOC106167508 [Lingula anatina]